MEQTSLCMFVAAHREEAKREARALHRVAGSMKNGAAR
jgi:hypothetical protein